MVSMLSIKFLMNYVKKHDFKVFGWYRIVLGALVIAYFFVLWRLIMFWYCYKIIRYESEI